MKIPPPTMAIEIKYNYFFFFTRLRQIRSVAVSSSAQRELNSSQLVA
jgi:hypothetical protein